MSQAFDFENLVELCRRTHEETQRSAAHAVDRSLVVRNYLFGWYIIEYEQHGADRAEYRNRLIARLSDQLKSSGIKGDSPTNLWMFREFYHAYPEIPQTASMELAKRLPLAWSHYVTLLTIDNPEERRFYEIEAIDNDWSVRKNDAVVELTLSEEANIYAPKYQLYLPSKQELVTQLESIRRELNYREGEDGE